VRFIKFSILYKIFIATIFFSTFVSVSHGQFPSTPGDEIDNPDYDPDVEVPLDGGVSLLVAAGVAYGVKRAYDKRKKDKEGDLV
jgi:hypothetical protein